MCTCIPGDKLAAGSFKWLGLVGYIVTVLPAYDADLPVVARLVDIKGDILKFENRDRTHFRMDGRDIRDLVIFKPRT